MGYFPHIDGLRALAVIGVLIFHASPEFLPGGFAGVDVFFVISGFLITSIIAKELDEGRFSLIDFYARRARRILPALITVCIACAIAGYFILLPDAYEEFGKSLSACALFVANLHFYRRSDYFAAAGHERPLLHTWSLSIEEQFYAIWPLLLMGVFWMRSRVAIGLVLTIGLAASLVYSEYATERFEKYAFFMLHARAWEFFAGAAVALFGARVVMSKGVAEAGIAAGLIAIIASYLQLSEASSFPGLSALPPCLGAAAVILCGQKHPTLIGRYVFSNPVAVTIGLLSYSIYLWHWPALAFTRYYLERSLTLPEAWAAVALSVAGAALAYQFIEKPLRRPHTVNSPHHKLRQTNVAAVAFSLVALAGLFAAGEYIGHAQGFIARFPEEVRVVFSQKASTNPKRKRCHGFKNVNRNDDICTFGAAKSAGASFDIVVIGDSHANHFAPMLAKFAENAGFSGRQLTNSDCAPLIGANILRQRHEKIAECIKFQNEVAIFLANNPGLKFVFLAGNWRAYQGDVKNGAGGTSLLALDTTEVGTSQTLAGVLARTAHIAGQHGARVVIMGSVPHLGDLPLRCVTRSLQSHTDSNACGPMGDTIRADLEKSRNAIAAVLKGDENVTVISPMDVLCQGERCKLMLDGVFLYADQGHLNLPGAETLGHYLPLAQLK